MAVIAATDGGWMISLNYFHCLRDELLSIKNQFFAEGAAKI